MNSKNIIVIAHDIRSTHNVGSLLRTCEGLGVRHVYFTGYTPYPPQEANDTRLPHIAQKLGRQIHKTALDAEMLVPWSQQNDVTTVINDVKAAGYSVVGLEQTSNSIVLPDYIAPDKVALLLGREVEGIASDVLGLCDAVVEIPMLGQKESFNVVQAAAMALYQFRFA